MGQVANTAADLCQKSWLMTQLTASGFCVKHRSFASVSFDGQDYGSSHLPMCTEDRGPDQSRSALLINGCFACSILHDDSIFACGLLGLVEEASKCSLYLHARAANASDYS